MNTIVLDDGTDGVLLARPIRLEVNTTFNAVPGRTYAPVVRSRDTETEDVLPLLEEQ